MQKGKFNILIGGQAGSEAKGKLSGYLCEKYQPDLLVMTASPNAGHTIVLNGRKKVSYHLPIGMVMCNCPLVLGPASLINPVILRKEIHDLGIDPARITIDPRASVITPQHIHTEVNGRLSDIGSTLQGIGSCRMEKMKREEGHLTMGEIVLRKSFSIASTSPIINSALRKGKTVFCEMTQGFDLDLEHGIDSIHCTSKMINPAMAMAEAGVSPIHVGEIYGAIRPYPIRVNNRTGSSGPYAEAEELSWSEIAIRCDFPGAPEDLGEITTTTKLPRRVFEFSWERFEKFVEICTPTVLCLQFANYLDWDIYGRGENEWQEKDLIPTEVRDFVKALSKYVSVEYIGTGPDNKHIIDIYC